MDFVRQAVWLAPSKKKRRRRGGELVEVPQTILVLALFLFSIIEMNWILRAEKECAVGGSRGVRIVSFCVSSPFFWSKWSNKYMRDRHKRTSALWMSACVWERECLGVCVAFHVHCVVPCPCQAPHTDQTLSLSGSAGCRDRAGKAAHKKRTGHRFYCSCALMSFFSAAGANPDRAVDLAYGTSYVTCPFCPHIVSSSSKCAGAVDGSVRFKKKTERRGDVGRTEPPVEGSDFICKHRNRFCLMFAHLSCLCSVLKEKRSASENNP